MKWISIKDIVPGTKEFQPYEYNWLIVGKLHPSGDDMTSWRIGRYIPTKGFGWEFRCDRCPAVYAYDSVSDFSIDEITHFMYIPAIIEE